MHYLCTNTEMYPETFHWTGRVESKTAKVGVQLREEEEGGSGRSQLERNSYWLYFILIIV